MTFQEFQKSWRSWLVFATVVVAFGFRRHWDTMSFVLAGVLAVTGILRLFSGPMRGFAVGQMARGLAQMTPEQRERELQKLPPEQREQVLRALENHTAS